MASDRTLEEAPLSRGHAAESQPPRGFHLPETPLRRFSNAGEMATTDLDSLLGKASLLEGSAMGTGGGD